MDRIKKVQERLDKWNVDLLIIDNPVDLFYMTGEELSAGRLLISEEGAALYVDGRYYGRCNKALAIPVFLLGRESPLPQFEGMRIGFDAGYTTYENYERLTALKGERIPLLSPIGEIRQVKEPQEIESLRRAAELGSKGFDFVVSSLAEGVTEEELALELELYWRKEGGERLAFRPHIAFGENSAYPHYHVGKRALKRGDLVLIDIGVVLNRYHSDMTRVLFYGEPDFELQKIYRIVHQAQLKALKLCKPGRPLAELDRAARSLIEEAGYGESFLHSLGHGVGLEIHEGPWIRKGASGTLREGMVVTIEPGIYLEGKGGVRLEDTVVITSEGFENLTKRPILASPTIG
ncbi:MAG: aminopeptidase P family protein [Chlamydiales bacterium]|nr:aminopeptidase P family protein [Chlamydiales bacterium]